ncbi:unnamed protein product [Sympodiomycopsis kandeliae]
MASQTEVNSPVSEGSDTSAIDYVPKTNADGHNTPSSEDRASIKSNSVSKETAFDEKHAHESTNAKVELVDGGALPGQGTEFDELNGTGQVKFGADGEPIIQNGSDVSRYLVSTRDDGDAALTFRSIVLGTIFTALSSSITMIYIFKPSQQQVSSLFLQLLVYVFGLGWAKLTPDPERFKNRALRSTLRFVNSGQPFRIKEHVVASLIASSGNNGLAGVEAYAVENLFYNKTVSPLLGILGTFSITTCGFVIAGLLRPIAIYPSEMVYWTTLPQVTLFQNLHFKMSDNKSRVKKFLSVIGISAIWEIFPAYIAPWTNGLSVFCLASMGASENTRSVFTNVFGGASSNEGMGILNLSLDWQYITSSYLSYPLKFLGNIWTGTLFGWIIMLALYYSNAWDAKTFPFMSSSLFLESGKRFKQASIIGSDLKVDYEKLAVQGLPKLTATTIVAYLTQNAAIGALITHVAIFYGPSIWRTVKQAHQGKVADPHYQAMRKYKEVPMWWYLILFALALIAGCVANAKGETTLPVWGFIIALLVGSFIAPFSLVLYALFGSGVSTTSISKMIGGAIHPGSPLAVLYFSSWSHQVILLAVNLSNWLKVGQYTKVPHRTMFLTQIYASLLGAAFNYVVMESIVKNQREILLDPIGNATWSGSYIQSFNSSAITWSLAKQVYSLSGPYWIVPMALPIGLGIPLVHWGITKYLPRLRSIPITTPLIILYIGNYSVGNTSYITSTVIVGLLSQFYLRKYKAKWYNENNYLVGAALDGGSQIMIFILSFAVLGAGRPAVPFPTWFGNPDGNPDHCLAS